MCSSTATTSYLSNFFPMSISLRVPHDVTLIVRIFKFLLPRLLSLTSCTAAVLIVTAASNCGPPASSAAHCPPGKGSLMHVPWLRGEAARPPAGLPAGPRRSRGPRKSRDRANQPRKPLSFLGATGFRLAEAHNGVLLPLGSLRASTWPGRNTPSSCRPAPVRCAGLLPVGGGSRAHGRTTCL